MKRLLCILALLLFKGSISVAQIDTAFWFAAPWVTPSHNDSVPVYLRLATFGNPTTVRVYQPAGSFDTTITIPANSLFSKHLSALIPTLESKPANTVLPYGLRVHSDNPITAVYEVVTTNNLNPETYSLKGQNGLGTEFVCPFQTKWDIGSFSPVAPYSQINIVATENNTVVWITPKCNVKGHVANTSYSVTLNEGETFTVENTSELESVNGNNMSGTIIVSDKPIAVTVSDDSVTDTNGGGCRDLMGDQIVPTDVIGTQYIVNKGQMYDGTSMGGTNPSLFDSEEGIFMVATKNFTTITVNDGSVTTYTLNQGDTKYFRISQLLTYVTSDKNIYVIQATGFGCELGEAILPPINCSGSQQISFTRTNKQSFILNILCRSGAEGSFQLNGNPALVPASSFSVVPGTSNQWMGAQISFDTLQIVPGSANLLTNSTDNFSMGVINGGATTGCLFHYMSSFIRRVVTFAGYDQLQCSNSINVNLNGTVTGGSSSGVWSTTNGTGTFSAPNSLSTHYTLSGVDSTKSVLTFVLTSTGSCLPVSDTVIIHLAQSPIVTAGADITQCANNVAAVNLTGYFNYSYGAVWSGGNGGSFGNAGSTTTSYTPSPADISAGQALITYSTTGSPFGCPNAIDTVKLFFTPAPVVNAGGNISVCANTTTVALPGSVSGGSTTGQWTTSGSGTFLANNTSLPATYSLSAADRAQSNFMIHLVSTNNGLCKAVSDSILVTVTAAPLVNAGANDTACSNMGSIQLNGSVTAGASSGTWSTIGGAGRFANANALNTIYTMGAADTTVGSVTIVLSSTGGTCPSVKDTVVYTIVKAPTVLAGSDQSVCDNQGIVLNGVITGFTTTGNWSTTGTGSFSPNNSQLNATYYPSASDITAGTIKFILTSSNNAGCNPSIDTMKATFIPSPASNFNFANNCFGSSSSFTDASTTTVGTITTYSWSFGDGSGASTATASHPYSAPNTYTVSHIVTASNGCQDTIQKLITVYSLPNANFTFNTPCQGNFTNFLDTSTALPANVVSWHWNFGDGTIDTVNQNPSHIYPTATAYTVTLVVESSLGCVDSIKKPVVVRLSPSADFSMSENPANALDVISFTDHSSPSSTIASWYWNFGDTLLSNQENPTHAYQTQGDYAVVLVVTDQWGCKDTARKDISINLLPQIPTAFTPNNDGANDQLYVRGGPFQKLHFRVYNNWGQLVFETNDQNVGWNGTMSGEEQPMGVYVWVLDVETFNKKTIHKTGDVTLLK